LTSDSLASIRGRIGGLSLAAQCDPHIYTARARATFLAKFEAEVDLDGLLSPTERQRRAAAARRLYFTKLAYRSAQVRRKKGGAK